MYFKENPKRPNRLSATSKAISEEIKSYRDTYTEFICEVPSVKGITAGITQIREDSPYVLPVTSLYEKASQPITQTEVEPVFTAAIACLKDAHEVCRKKATEVIVWILSDTDRCYDPQIPYSIPVAYAMKGYSLGVKQMRAMHDTVLQSCHSSGLDIVCSCFDGQWVKVATRDGKDKPLTLLQLQRDVYDESCKMSRNTIINEMLTTRIVDSEGYRVERNASGVIVVSCSLFYKMLESARNAQTKKTSCKTSDCTGSQTKKSDHSEKGPETVDHLSNLPDEALETFIDNDDAVRDYIDISVSTNTSENNRRDNFIDEPASDEAFAAAEDDADTEKEASKRGVVISEELLEQILLKLKDHESKRISVRWKDKSVHNLKESINHHELLHQMQHAELNVIIETTNMHYSNAQIIVKRSSKLAEKANQISKIIGNGQEIQPQNTIKHMLPLKEFAAKIVRKSNKSVPKSILNATHSAMVFERSVTNWTEKSPFAQGMQIQDVGSTNLFSYPEFSESRQRYEPKCLDAHHLLVNLRVKVCKDGLQGIRKKAWHEVADKNREVISKALVVDLVDKQNNGFAKRTFSAEVEDTMRGLDFKEEANFCRMVREWYEAEDAAGLSALERVERRLKLKSYLLKDVDFGVFPPPGMFIKGFSKTMFEGFLQRIDTLIQLYTVVKSGSFNQRSVSSLANETFFGELSEIEPTRLGCPKAINIPRLMSTVTELQHYRSVPAER